MQHSAHSETAVAAPFSCRGTPCCRPPLDGGARLRSPHTQPNAASPLPSCRMLLKEAPEKDEAGLSSWLTTALDKATRERGREGRAESHGLSFPWQD